MKIQKYECHIPFEIGDIITPTDFKNEYEILDIIHKFSCKVGTIVAIYFELKDIATDATILLNYEDFEWKMVKQNDETI